MNESVEQIDPTSELTVEVVKKRAVSGALILTFRTFLIQAISFFSNVLLTVFLEPIQYGVFFLVSAVVNFLAYFGDIGFAAALVQKKENLTKDDLKTIFTAQQILVLILVIFVLIATPLIRDVYKFEQESIYLLWALTFSLFISSLKTIPSVLLERRLDFNKLVIPQIVETILFNITAVYLAWKGFGITSFTVAVLIRSITGLVLIYILQPWTPIIGFSKQTFRSLLRFGIPYQLNTFLAIIKDDGMTIFLGTILGSSGIGLLGWAQKWAFAPLRFFMDQVIKVTFPAFSRIQDNKKELSVAVSKSIFFISLLVFPSLVILVLMAPSLIEIIPKYEKWRPALTALTLISIISALAAITTPLTNMFNAIGRISLTFKLMVMWTVLTWVFVPLLSLKFGLNGAALGFSLVGLSSVVALVLATKYIDINYFKISGRPMIASIIMGLVVFYIQSLLTLSIIGVITQIVIGVIVYSIIIFIFEPKIISQISILFKISKS